MKTFRQLLIILLLPTICCPPALAAKAFVIGVAPHTSARVILEMYQPLRLHLEKELGCRVDVVTAPNFDELARRALTGSYDMVITTGHQARLLQIDAGYIPLVTYRANFKAVALVKADGPVINPSDLKGQEVLGLSRSSLVTMWGEQWLKARRIKTRPIRYVSASDSVAQLVAAGEAAAGFTSLANFQRLPAKLRSRLRVIAESRPMAGRIYMFNPRSPASQKAISAALWSFATTPAGRKYFKIHNLGGYRQVTNTELRQLDSYAVQVRKILRSSQK